MTPAHRRASGPDRRGAPAQRQRGLAGAGAAVLRGRRRHGRRQGGRGRLGDGGRARSRARPSSGEPAEAQLTRILREANRRIYELAVSDDSHRGMGTTVTAAKVTGRRDQPRPRRRQPRLPPARRRARAAHARPLAGRRARAQRPDHARGGRAPPAALDHHARARPGARRPGRHLHARGPRRRPLPDLLRRPDEHDLRRRAGLDPALRGRRSTRPPTRSCARPTRAAARTTSRSCCSASATATTATSCRARTRRSPASSRRPRSTRRRSTRTTEPQPAAPQAPVESLDDMPPDATIVAPPRARARARAPPRRRRRARAQAAVKTLVVLAVLAGIGTGLYALSRQVYFLGTNDAGLVTLYRGVPYELPFGIDLYEQQYASGVPARRDPEHPPQAGARPRVARARRRRGPAAHARAGPAVGLMSARTRELFGLIPVSLLVAAGFAAVLATRSEDDQRRHAHLRGLLPRALRGRAPVHPRAAARRRPVPVPARRAARRGRARPDLPHRPGVRARAGAVVRGRAHLLLRRRSG